jgi:N-acetyl-gamma-glutamyl-phosphate reductase
MALSLLRVGIVGGAGYTGGELLRLLLHHPAVNIVFVHSSSSAGKAISDVHHDLLGDDRSADTTPLCFTGTLPQTADEWSALGLDVLFLCVGHGEASAFMASHVLPTELIVIDLSHDFRYAPEPTDVAARRWVYGLPELHRERICAARSENLSIANPGCFATCIQLGLLPLAAAGLLAGNIHTSAITGSTGAGQSLSATSHFSWRSNNVSVYKALKHQHVREIRSSLVCLQPSFGGRVNFVPYRGSFTRGILATSYIHREEMSAAAPHTLAEFEEIVAEYYASHPFVHISRRSPDVKQVVNTNKCVVYLEYHDDTLVVITAIDNLLKGASGQAVQNMNLVFGLPETTGLQLKASAF